MPLESPRDLRFEGANAPEHRRPRASDGSRDFALFVFPIPHPSYNNFPAFRGTRPASRSASRRRGYLFRAGPRKIRWVLAVFEWKVPAAPT